MASDLHEHAKSVETNATCKDWVEDNVGMKDLYACELRTVAALLHGSPQFKKSHKSLISDFTICENSSFFFE